MQDNQEWQEYVVNCYRSYYRHYHVNYDPGLEPIITIEQTPEASRRWLHMRASMRK